MMKTLPITRPLVAQLVPGDGGCIPVPHAGPAVPQRNCWDPRTWGAAPKQATEGSEIVIQLPHPDSPIQ